MSRVIVKGIPSYYTEVKLRDHFAEKGNVTDVKLKKKNNGESRRFAFIGYKDIKDAENAVKFFNGSFIDTSKITVELAKSFSDPNVPISWKEKKKQRDELLARTEERLKRMEEAASRKKLKKQKKVNNLSEKIENNPHLKEFVETMKSANQSKSWANDELVNVDGAPTNSQLEKALGIKNNNYNNDDNDADAPVKIPSVISHKGDDSDNEYDDFLMNENKIEEDEDDDNDAGLINKNINRDEDEPMIPFSEFKDTNQNDNKSNDDNGDDDDEKKTEDVDDLDWFKSKRKRMVDGAEVIEVAEEESKKESFDKDIKNVNGNAEIKTLDANKEEELQKELSLEEKNIDKILVTGRLFLRNILYSSTEDDFKQLFQPYGELKEVHIAVDSRTGKSKGFAYIQFENPKDAMKAYIQLDKQIFQGRLLHILPADIKKEHKLDEFELKNMPLKKQRLLKKKFEASKQEFSWNSLYMNSDAVLESVASQLGISKNELIDPTNSSSAIKQALAEAHVIGDVRTYFEAKGIDLTKFSERERDDKIILVKNFQYGTTREEIGELFAAYGELNRILMPPAGTIAIIEFRDLSSARTAFTKLSFRRLGKSILYLEKGPKNLFIKPADESDNIKLEEKTKEVKVTAKEIMEKDVLNNEDKENEGENEDDDEDENSGPTVSIFIKNLNFTTTSGSLSNIFKPYPGFLLAVIKTKPDPKNIGKTLSMGFGFAEFRTREQANAALKSLDGFTLDGHRLQLKISNRVGSKDEDSSKGKNKRNKSGKIIVKNLPFEATRKDVFELFNSFGSLKSVRVPKKFDKSARGFAFVEFSTSKEASNAMDQLQGVHLLGRRLVLDYAEKESDDVEAEIEKMTKKTKTQVRTRELADLREGNSGKRKLELEEDDEY
jgi:multiple RNA-binding domain-containing protein 1